MCKICCNTKSLCSGLKAGAVLLQHWQKSKLGNIFWQHLLNISHFQNLFFFLSLPDLIMSLITSSYIRRSEKFMFTVGAPFPRALATLNTISHRPRHMCQTITFASGCPRPIPPHGLKQYATSFHCARRARLHNRLPLHRASRAPAMRPHVWVPILSPGVMRVRGHACLCRRASGEGKRTFTHACISGNPLSPM